MKEERQILFTGDVILLFTNGIVPTTDGLRAAGEKWTINPYHLDGRQHERYDLGDLKSYCIGHS